MTDSQLDELAELSKRGALHWNHADIIRAKRGIEELLVELRSRRERASVTEPFRALIDRLSDQYIDGQAGTRVAWDFHATIAREWPRIAERCQQLIGSVLVCEDSHREGRCSSHSTLIGNLDKW